MTRVFIALFAAAGLSATAPTSATEREAEPAIPKLLQITAPKAEGEAGKLMQQRYAEAQSEMILNLKVQAAGGQGESGVNSTANAAGRLTSSYLALEPTKDERLAFLAALVDYMKATEESIKQRVNAGTARKQELHRAAYYRLDAEVQLAKAKEGK